MPKAYGSQSLNEGMRERVSLVKLDSFCGGFIYLLFTCTLVSDAFSVIKTLEIGTGDFINLMKIRLRLLQEFHKV